MSLQLDGIGYRYPNTAGTVLEQLDLRVATGRIVGVKGPSGSGKSTLLRIAALMQSADTGTVSISGERVDAGAPVSASLRRRIGVVPQSPRAATDPRLKLGAVLASPLAFRDRAWRPRQGRYTAALHRWCERVELDPGLLSRTAAEVSDGQLQRVLLARALLLDPAVLVCDEPTAQLDGQTTTLILRLLAEQAGRGAAVLIASHDRQSLESICHEVVQLGSLQRS
ncbi:ATP-binding cassette domain-containing protein [Glutamicibacter sp. MNS18]|uniref:ATP-binding cassette domain-containing protein n=1 Tax=Glutamicibacter sp. MNS18 TaxID=2989817 RepID=UPI00223654A5|nr:ATP-binding cassette domain-containing protein [Glutamicibacter sp. MNS18]MCW4466073.1 ATP-binding cassette domain-containing protein [Glutamicibacter sp. MNS18]